MPQATQRTGKSLAHVLFLSAALSLLSALVRRERRQLVLTARDRRKKVRVAPRRIAASLAFATLFFAGAALSAGAGNGVVQLIDPTSRSADERGHDDRHDDDDDDAGSIRRGSGRHVGRRPTSRRASDAVARRRSPPRQPVGRVVRRPRRRRASPPEPVAGRRSLEHERRRRPLDAQGAAPCRAQEAGRRVDRARAAGQRPDGSRPSPSPAGSACGQGDEGRSAPQGDRPRARGGRAERGRHRVAVPRPTGSDAALAPSEAGLRPPTRPRVQAESRRLGAGPRRPSRARRPWRRAGLRGAAPDADEASRPPGREARRVGLGALARGQHLVRRPHDRAQEPLPRSRAQGARQGLRLGQAPPREADPERQADHHLSGWPVRHREPPRERARARDDRVPRRGARSGHGLVPDQRPSAVRAPGRRSRRTSTGSPPTSPRWAASRSSGTSSPTARSPRRRCGTSCSSRPRCSRGRSSPCSASEDRRSRWRTTTTTSTSGTRLDEGNDSQAG